jgi:hypothetical protein
MGASGIGVAGVDRAIVLVIARDRRAGGALAFVANRRAGASISGSADRSLAIRVGAIRHSVAVVIGSVVAKLGERNAIESASAGLAGAGVASLDAAIVGAAISSLDVAVVADLARFDRAIAADRRRAFVGANFVLAANRIAASRSRAIVGAILADRADRIAANRVAGASAIVGAVFPGIAATVAADRFAAIVGAILGRSTKAVAADGQGQFI